MVYLAWPQAFVCGDVDEKKQHDSTARIIRFVVLILLPSSIDERCSNHHIYSITKRHFMQQDEEWAELGENHVPRISFVILAPQNCLTQILRLVPTF